MKLTHINSILLTLVAGMLLVACSSPTEQQGSQLEFRFAQFDVLNKAHSRFTRQTLGDTSNITSVKIQINEFVEGEKKEITSATLSEELEAVTIKIPSNKNLNIRGEAFAGETLLYIGNMNLVALLPGAKQPVNLVMYPVDENAEPIQVDIGVANKVGNGPSYGATFSYSRDYVLFTSDADNLVEDDTNQKRDLFLKNVKTGDITNIHVDENGKPVATSDNTGPTGADISADGRYIVFASNADGIVAADKNGLSDIFLRDTLLNTVKLISKKGDGTLSDKDSYNPSISDDGRFVAFSSDAALVGKEAGVFLYDRITSTLSFLLANAVNPKFSGNGGFLVYVDRSDGNLYRYNTTNKTKLRITSVNTTSTQKLEKAQQTLLTSSSKMFNRDHITLNQFEYVINESGRFIVFVPYQNTEELKSHHVYVYDDNDKSISLVSADANGDPLPLNDKLSRFLSISQDGRYIAFLFNSTVYVKSTVDKQLSPVTHGSYPFISPDGREIGYSDSVTGHLFFLPNPIFSVIAGGESNSGIPTNLAYKISGNDVIISWDAIANTSFYRTYVGTSSDIKNSVSTSISDITKNELILSFSDITKTQFFVAVSSVNSRGESAISTVLKLPSGDLTPPTVLENTISPQADTVDVDTNATVSFSFSEAMASGSVNNLSIRLNNGLIDLPTTVKLTGKDVTLTPKVPLAPFQAYEVTVSSDVADLSGNILGTDYVWTFTTGFELNKVDSGNHHSCGIRNDTTLWCWGQNDNGQLGDGTTETKVGPVQVQVNAEYELIDSWESVATGGSHSCAIKTDGSLWCWGYNSVWGTVGSGSGMNELSPVQIHNGDSSMWEQVSAGGNHTCAIDVNKALWCWGGHFFGQLGVGDFDGDKLLTPNRVGEANDWIDISSGEDLSCGIRQGATLAEKSLNCWGKTWADPNEYRLLYGSSPELVTEDKDWATISVGGKHICATKTSGIARCWGSNYGGALGVDSLVTLSSDVPVQESTVTSDWATIMAARSYHTCGIKFDGLMYCWGENNEGQLADEDLTDRFTAKQEFSLADDWAMVSGGINTTCGIKRDDTLLCWGDNNYGQTGAGQNIITLSPTPVQPEKTDWSMVSAAMGDGYRYEGSDHHSCGLRNNGTLYCWGANWNGQLGIGNTSNQFIPMKSNISTLFKSLSVGGDHSCAISNSDELWCWGSHNNGELGLGFIEGSYITIPESLSITDNAWASVSAGYYHTCGIKNNNTLWCWGNDYYGQLGINIGDGSIYEPKAIYIPTINLGSGNISLFEDSWLQVSAGAYHTCAVNSDASLWCWGSNYEDQLGIGFSELNFSPMALRVGLSNNWTQIATGDNHTCGIQSDKSLWCWGKNDYYIGIDNDSQSTFNEPQQVASESSWETVDANFTTTCAIKTDGSLWCWGYGGGGKLGTGDQTGQALPTQEITKSIDWKDVSVGADHTCATKNDNSLWCWGWNSNGSVGTNHFFYAPQHVNFNAIGEQKIFFEYSDGKFISAP